MKTTHEQQLAYLNKKYQENLESLPRAIKGGATVEVLEDILEILDIIDDLKELSIDDREYKKRNNQISQQV